MTGAEFRREGRRWRPLEVSINEVPRSNFTSWESTSIFEIAPASDWVCLVIVDRGSSPPVSAAGSVLDPNVFIEPIHNFSAPAPFSDIKIEKGSRGEKC